MIASIYTCWSTLRARSETRSYRIGHGVAVSLPRDNRRVPLRVAADLRPNAR